MQGKWDPASPEETQVETALFGRITPYTRIVHSLRRLQMHVAAKCHIGLPQDALYRINSTKSLLNKPADFWSDTIVLYAETLPKMDQALAEWIPQNPAEQYARAALESVVTNVRAALALMQFSQSRTAYRQAAIAQFTDPASYCERLAEMEEVLGTAVQSMKTSRKVKEDSIANTGITRQDLLWQDRVIAYLLSLQEKLQKFQQDSLSMVSLPCFTEFLYSWEFGEDGLVP